MKGLLCRASRWHSIAPSHHTNIESRFYSSWGGLCPEACVACRTAVAQQEEGNMSPHPAPSSYSFQTLLETLGDVSLHA